MTDVHQPGGGVGAGGRREKVAPHDPPVTELFLYTAFFHHQHPEGCPPGEGVGVADGETTPGRGVWFFVREREKRRTGGSLARTNPRWYPPRRGAGPTERNPLWPDIFDPLDDEDDRRRGRQLLLYGREEIRRAAALLQAFMRRDLGAIHALGPTKPDDMSEGWVWLAALDYRPEQRKSNP